MDLVHEIKQKVLHRQPYFYHFGINTPDKEKIAEYVNMYGNDSLSCLALEGGRNYYTIKCTKGYIPYIVIKKIAICVGDPICAKGFEQEVFLEFADFCKFHKWKMCLTSMGETYKNIAMQEKYEVSYYGKEAILDLNEYNMSGKKREKLRQKVKRATAEETYVMEYDPVKQKNEQLEEKINALSENWFRDKGRHMQFAVGDLDFQNPFGRRYFLLMTKDAQLEAVTMFSPFEQGKGYFLDVMRRQPNSVVGAMEKLIIDTAFLLQKEGVRWISLGIAPLKGMDEIGDEKNKLERLFSYIYENHSKGYDFKTLGQFKEKFNPNEWRKRYVIADARLSPFMVAYVLAKSRNNNFFKGKLLKGIRTYIIKK